MTYDASRPPSAAEMHWTVHRFEEIASTNDEALARIRRGAAAGGEVFVARVQTGGRGRHGREWRSEAGGRGATAMLPACEPLAGAGMAGGVAVCRVRACDNTWEGTALGLGDSGALLVRQDTGTVRRVDAGEVEFR